MTSDQPPFCAVEYVFMDDYLPLLGVEAFAVYCGLLRRVDYETRLCYPSQNTLATMTGLSRPTVRKALDLLAQVRVIRIQERRLRDGLGSRLSHVYTLMPLLPLSVEEKDRLRAVVAATQKTRHLTPKVVNEAYVGCQRGLQGVVNEADKGCKPDLHDLVNEVAPNENHLTRIRERESGFTADAAGRTSPAPVLDLEEFSLQSEPVPAKKLNAPVFGAKHSPPAKQSKPTPPPDPRVRVVLEGIQKIWAFTNWGIVGQQVKKILALSMAPQPDEIIEAFGVWYTQNKHQAVTKGINITWFANAVGEIVCAMRQGRQVGDRDRTAWMQQIEDEIKTMQWKER